MRGKDLEYPTLYTERFFLKALMPEMVGEEYLSWLISEETADYILYARNKIVMTELVEYVREKYMNPRVLFLGIFLKDTGEHIGNIKFEPMDSEEHYAVLGILIGNVAWRGKGVFSEISKILEKALRESSIKKIYLGVQKRNQLAVKSYLKEGYEIDNENFLKMDLDKDYCMVKYI